MARILVVDDRAPNRQLMVKLLGYVGHACLEAADGVEALKVVASERPDLVICDIIMPRARGPDLVHRLRCQPELAQTAVIFWTASYLEREARVVAGEFGVKDVMLKGDDPQEILR